MTTEAEQADEGLKSGVAGSEEGVGNVLRGENVALERYD
jgi:hypothetical protein